MPTSCVLGAGITGLSYAWKLQLTGVPCHVLECNTRIGGNLQSHRNNDYLYEEGPHSLLLKSAEEAAFITSIPGLQARIVAANPSAKKRFVTKDGCLHPVPQTLRAAWQSKLLSAGGKLRLLGESLVPRKLAPQDESIANFARRRFGKEAYQYLVNPMISGIYAGDPEELSLQHALPRLAALEHEYGSITSGLFNASITQLTREKKSHKPQVISFIDGMHELPQKIACALKPDSIETGIKLRQISQHGSKWHIRWSNAQQTLQCQEFDQIIITIPAHRMGQLPLPAALLPFLKCFNAIQHPQVTVSNFSFKRTSIKHPLDGFGFLQPKSERQHVLGVLFPSSLFAHRAPSDEHLVSIFSNGPVPTEQLLQEIRPLLEINGQWTSQHCKNWSQAIPQYTCGYASTLNAITQIERQYPGLHFIGNYRNGVALGNCLQADLKPPASQSFNHCVL